MRTRRLFAHLALLLTAFACGGGGADAVGPDGLTRSDVDAMVTALNELGAFEFDLGLVSAQPASPGLAAQMRETTFDKDVPCTAGGAVHATGKLETYYSGTQSAYLADVEQTHIGCTTPMANGHQWTFDGNPSVKLHIEYIVNSSTHVIRMLGTFKGSFAWTSNGGLSGTCTADIKLNGNAVPATKNDPATGALVVQIAGAFCTRNVTVHN